MIEARFLQIHTLTGYPAALLNRDDSGLAKRLPYGGATRTRVSSQSLKRHWRAADDVNALSGIDDAESSTRSREIVTELLRAPLNGRIDAKILDAAEAEFQKAVYGEKADKGKSNRQPLIFGAPETRFLAGKFADVVRSAANPKDAQEKAAAFAKSFKAEMKTMRESAKLPGGLVSAMFGRMVTSDPEANIDAAIHVAHAFTVHEEEAEADYFTVVDDLKKDGDDSGADHIGETELSSGLFYGYVVVDVRALAANLGGDRDLAAETVRRLLHLMAEVSPGAKLGSTAPYGRAALMLVEAGNRQPRSLAEAWRKPCKAQIGAAEAALNDHLARLDDAYATGEARRVMSLSGTVPPGAARVSLPDLAIWAAKVVKEGTA